MDTTDPTAEPGPLDGQQDGFLAQHEEDTPPDPGALASEPDSDPDRPHEGHSEQDHDHSKCTHGHGLDAGPPPSTESPALIVDSVSDAVDWYVHVFNVEIAAATDINNKMVHAELALGQGTIQLRDSALQPEPADDAPATPTCAALTVTCRDIEAVLAKARDRGATCAHISLGGDDTATEASFQDLFDVHWTLTDSLSRLELREP